MQEGSCRRGERCIFSHKITREQREDISFVETIQKEKDEKASKCLNEYREKGSCRNGVKCPFSHRISEEDKKNKELQKKMTKTRNTVVGNNGDNESSKTNGGRMTAKLDMQSIELTRQMLAVMTEVQEFLKKQRNP